MKRCIVLFASLLALSLTLRGARAADDWPQWRG